MRTTIDLPDTLLRELKAKAAIEGTTLKQLVLTLVERGLQGSVEPASARSKKSALPALDLKHPLAIRSFSNARLFELLDD
ncbi:MAG TPA: hypothetical protein VIM34_21715 [Burkholderiaceae bacterium]